MTNLQLQLDPVALREAATQAIMGVLTPEVRQKMIEQAISAVLKPSTDSWNRDKSPLSQAFDAAIVQVAREEAKRLVSEDPTIRDRMTVLLRSTADKVLNMDAEKLSEKMAEAFVDSMRER